MSEQIEQKIKLVGKMMSLYCKKHHRPNNNGGLCEDCENLQQYSAQRNRNCKNQNSFCAHCTSPCYAAEKRVQMRKVMKFSGPRIALYHPFWVGKHMIETRRKNREHRKKSKNNG